MPLDLTSLLTGANQLLAARGQGQVTGEQMRAQEEERRAQIQRQVVLDSLNRRNIESEITRRTDLTNLARNRPPPGQVGKYVPHFNDDGSVDYVWAPGAGEGAPGADQSPAASGAPQRPGPAVTPVASATPGRPAIVRSKQRVAPKMIRPLVGYTPGGDMTLVTPPRGRGQAQVDTVPGVGKPPNALEQKVQLGAQNAAAAARAAVALARRDAAANVMPVAAEIAEGAAESKIADYVPGLKGAAGALRRSQMTDSQQQFQNLLNVVAHNSVGLLPGSRQSIVLFQNLRSAYASAANDSPGVRAQKLQLLENLAAELERVARGERAQLQTLPGYEDYQPSRAAPPTIAPVAADTGPAPPAPVVAPPRPSPAINWSRYKP